MPIFSRWRPLSSLPASRGRDAMPGIYELADARKRLIYIGQSRSDVPNRIRQHLSRSSCIAEQAAFWRYQHSRIPESEEAAHLAHYRRLHGELPPCNRATPQPRDAVRRYRERSRGRE
jgi:hypothetical protein